MGYNEFCVIQHIQQVKASAKNKASSQVRLKQPGDVRETI